MNKRACRRMSNQRMGSAIDDFLREEEIFAEVEAAAIKKVLACIEQAMAETRPITP